MIRDVMLAYAFGTHEALAALFVAYRLANICRRLFGEGALQSAFIPYFEAMRKESSIKAFTFFRDLSCLMGIFLLGFAAVTMLLLYSTYYFIQWSIGNQEIVHLTILLMPSLFFICLFGLNMSLLQCQKRYFTAGIAPACFNVATAIGAYILHGTEPAQAMPYVTFFMIIGFFFQWFVSFMPALRSVKSILQEKIYSHIRLFTAEIRGLGRPLFLGIVGAGAAQINNAVDALFARYADPEGPAQLWYALRIQQLPLALFGIALSGALLPPLSRAIQAGNEKEYKSFLEFALRRVTAILLPSTIAIYAFGLPLINLIYGRGDFHLHSIYATTGCLYGYILGLLPTGFVIVLAPAFYAHKDYTTPAKGAFLSLITNLVLNALMVFVFHWKAVSVALATSISAWLNVLYLWKNLDVRAGSVLSSEGIREWVKIFTISSIAGALVWTAQAYTQLECSVFQIFNPPTVLLSTSFIEQITQFSLLAIPYVALVILFAWIAKASDILSILQMDRK